MGHLPKPTRERPGKYGLAQALGAPEVGIHLGLGFAQEGEAAVDFGDDAVLFGEGWQANGMCSTGLD